MAHIHIKLTVSEWDIGGKSDTTSYVLDSEVTQVGEELVVNKTFPKRYTFIVKEMSDAAIGLGMNKFTASVPVIVAVVQENMNLEAKAGALVKNKDYSMMDLGFAIDHFCLQAAELGLGTCIMGWFDEKRVKKVLGVPRSRRVQLLISLGYPDAPVRNKVRKPIEEMSSWNKY